MNTKPPEKKRTIALRSYVTEKEYEYIIKLSEQTALSISELTRRVLLGQQVQTREEAQAFFEMCKVSADQGRLGGLLKLWLSDPVKSQGYSQEVRRVLHQIEANQKRLKALIAEQRYDKH